MVEAYCRRCGRITVQEELSYETDSEERKVTRYKIKCLACGKEIDVGAGVVRYVHGYCSSCGRVTTFAIYKDFYYYYHADKVFERAVCLGCGKEPGGCYVTTVLMLSGYSIDSSVLNNWKAFKRLIIESGGSSIVDAYYRLSPALSYELIHNASKDVVLEILHSYIIPVAESIERNDLCKAMTLSSNLIDFISRNIGSGDLIGELNTLQENINKLSKRLCSMH